MARFSKYPQLESNPPVFPFPDPVKPEDPPFEVIPAPPHMSYEIWQSSYYDASSHEPMGIYQQLPSGACDLSTGRLLGGDFAGSDPWMQV